MPDIMSRSERSDRMSRIRGMNTRPERTLRAVLRRNRVRFRSYMQIRGVKVDLVLLDFRTAVLVHGCFWHGCRIHYSPPETNAAFWRQKLEQNRSRDQRQVRALRRAGWRVIVLWEHSIRRDSGYEVDRALLKKLRPAETQRRELEAS
jgi:DNA mismatch endonuclease (patch repair protein)